MTLDLPKDMTNGQYTLTASTPSEYVALEFRGFTVVDGPAVASLAYDELTPAQKAARTRAENANAKPDVDPTAQAGNASEND